MPDSDFAAILGRGAGLLFPSSNRHGSLRQKNSRRRISRLHAFFWSFSLFFAPKLRATSAPIGPRERVAERVRTQALSQLSNLLFLLSEVE
jgi:hypothetical protein